MVRFPTQGNPHTAPALPRHFVPLHPANNDHDDDGNAGTHKARAHPPHHHRTTMTRAFWQPTPRRHQQPHHAPHAASAAHNGVARAASDVAGQLARASDMRPCEPPPWPPESVWCVRGTHGTTRRSVESTTERIDGRRNSRAPKMRQHEEATSADVAVRAASSVPSVAHAFRR